jgi:hypothetical protein
MTPPLLLGSVASSHVESGAVTPAFKTALGGAGSASSGTTLVITTTANIDADDLVVVRVAGDNLSATTPTITCTDSGGNTYTSHAFDGQNATAAAGCVGAILATRATSSVASGGTITITFSGAITAKAAYAESFVGFANFSEITALAVSGASTSPSSGASASVSSGSLVVGLIAVESNASVTADSDTSNGNWSTQVLQISAAGGTANTRVEAAGQYKITTGAGAQTFNGTITSTDWVACLVAFPVYTAPGTVATPTDRGSNRTEGFGSSAINTASSSFTPTANALLVCISIIETQKNTAVGSSMSSSGNFGIPGSGDGAWQKRVTVGPVTQSGGSGYFATAEIWVARCGASPTSGTITHTWTAPQNNWTQSVHFIEIASGFDPNVAAASSPTGATGSVQTTTNPTVTMSATPAGTSLVLGGCMVWDSGASAPITVPNLFTQLQDQVWTGWDARSKTAYRNNGGNSASHQWTAASAGNSSAVALEIPQA